jgi:hypothetical protein
MTSIVIDGRKYLVGRLDLFEAVGVARRLGPSLLSAVWAVLSAKDTGASTVGALLTGPVIEGLSKMTDDDTNWVLKTCLGVVRVEEGGTSSPVYDKAIKQMRYSDISMPAALHLVKAVIEENFGSFFPSGQPSSNPA